MSKWFRVYDDLVDDPKVILLPRDLFRPLIFLWCVASQNDGRLPSIEAITVKLRESPVRVRQILNGLKEAGFIDEDGTGLYPHNWNGRQYLSDDSTSRVHKYRNKRRNLGLPVLGDYAAFKPALISRDGERCVYCLATSKLVVDHMIPIDQNGTDHIDNLALACRACNSGKSGRTPEQSRLQFKVRTAEEAYLRFRVTVTVTPPDTEQIQSRAETDISIPSVSHCGRSATRSAVDQAFDEFWKAYPKRDGANPRAPAAKKFAAALKAGSSAEELVAGARAYRSACDEGKLTGTAMVAQAITWLNQQRWSDYAAQKPSTLAEPKGRDPPELPPEQRHFYRWFSSKTPEGLPPEQWQAFAEGRINGAEIS